ncbi:hypothetical protein GCM10022255_093430 [Dactylosporangium darangshiense]|uniref:Uncharacterized protein n=2 Tax=Dactylosporangium darangshiense TaxID=579108 RepID=A0ABP8DQ39_9ACTN
MIARVTEPPELLVGRPDADHLKIRVLGRMHAGSSDYWDGNWLLSPISAALGCFTAQIDAGLRVDELQTFRRRLEQINHQLQGEATLTSIEHWISLSVACLPNGSLCVTGQLDDDLGSGNVLSFTINDLDQTDLPTMLSTLSIIEQTYPFLGTP